MFETLSVYEKAVATQMIKRCVKIVPQGDKAITYKMGGEEVPGEVVAALLCKRVITSEFVESKESIKYRITDKFRQAYLNRQVP